jgi:hypothetical protein
MQASTYDNIKTEIIYEMTLIKDAINIMEYLNPKYFKQIFIDELKPIVLGTEPCKCNLPFVSHSKFQMIVIDILLQYKHREDIEIAIESIFNYDFTRK